MRLDARDVERLENTSFASAFANTAAAVAPLDATIEEVLGKLTPVIDVTMGPCYSQACSTICPTSGHLETLLGTLPTGAVDAPASAVDLLDAARGGA